MRATRFLGAATAVLAVCAVLVGCAPISPAGSGGAATDAPVAREDLDPEATIRYADAVGPSRFDPMRSTNGQDIRYLAPVYDRLVHLSPTGDPIPGLATAWEWQDDGLALRMTLRPTVRFHDGTAFDAEAVRANIERGKTVEGSSVAADLAGISGVEVVDPTTVVLRLAKRNSMLLGLLSHRAGSMLSPAAFGDPDLDLKPVGTGMYKVSEYRPNDVIVYERNADYWNPDVVGVRRIELRILADEVTRMNALRTGEVDVALLSGRLVGEAQGLPGVTVHRDTTLTYLVLYLNRARSEFGDPRVRQALNLAVNRQAIADGIYFGAAQPTVQPFPQKYYAYNPAYPGDYYAHDPARAKQLLAEAGLPNGFEFEMLVTALGTYLQSAEAVQQMLAEVGIRASIRAVEAAQTADVYYRQQQGDALVSQWGGRPDPSMTIDLQFTSTGFSNPGRVTTPRLEELQAQALDTLDQQQRTDLIHQEVGELVDQAFQVPLVMDESVIATGERITGFELLVTGQIDFQKLGVRKQR
ncbi:ABC transporter substrate-binding protein [Pseudonocardia pini]|uniref:ABC transporter substrate-binding protein n=1 Tax=Pseudonocardia pini TaxID=2758030 RepID=UPI0015EFEEE1|nr:ABC transporter substrate-binding protein [Pseudonocardia pini]